MQLFVCKVMNRNVAGNLSLPVRSRNGLGILKSWISWALNHVLFSHLFYFYKEYMENLQEPSCKGVSFGWLGFFCNYLSTFCT